MWGFSHDFAKINALRVLFSRPAFFFVCIYQIFKKMNTEKYFIYIFPKLKKRGNKFKHKFIRKALRTIIEFGYNQMSYNQLAIKLNVSSNKMQSFIRLCNDDSSPFNRFYLKGQIKLEIQLRKKLMANATDNDIDSIVELIRLIENSKPNNIRK